MSLIKSFPGHDLEASVSTAVKAIFMNQLAFRLKVDAFTVPASPESPVDMVQLPFVGVDFSTVSIEGTPFTEWSPEVFVPEGMVARLRFASPRTTPIPVNDHFRFTTYFVADPRDVSFDLFTFYGDEAAPLKQVRHIPLCFTSIDHLQPERKTAMGESVQVFGSMVLVAGADQGGVDTLKHEVKKLYTFGKQRAAAFGVAGLNNFVMEFPSYEPVENEAGGKLQEALVRFSCRVNLAPVNDAFLDLLGGVQA